MPHQREMQLTKDGGDSALVVDRLADFFHAAGHYPQRLIILRSDAAISAAELHRCCLALGGIEEYETAGKIRSIHNDPSVANSTAMSGMALPLHTDGTFRARPPERFMLSFLQADGKGGGYSTFMPISEILAVAPEWALEALLAADFLFPRGYDELTDSYVGPVLYRGRSGLRIRWRSDEIWRPKVDDARGTDAVGAVDWLHEFLTTSAPFTYMAQRGDTLLVPNTVMLHGRTALSADSPRKALRIWASGE